jgi:3-phenylpropionate/trans-cinnamate dioxygenase ferredoxin component
MLHYATDLKTLKEAFKMRIVVNEKPLLLVSFENQVYAIDDKCPHLGTSLDKGTLEGQHVTCKSHHAKIDVTTGDIVEKPKMLFIKVPIKKAKTYQVEIKNNKVFIHFPDAFSKK